ncbi:MAG: glycine oxidase ThiO [Pseudomonadales bacterium]|nr:glycine oxidase ThiO [Pseudomonadales bacterium]
MSDFIVIGGGIIGMLSSYTLACKGFSVKLIESQRCGQEASWAGGGIVSPLNPWDYPSSITKLASLSQRSYPLLVEQLLDRTGIDSELYQTGMMTILPDDDDLSSRQVTEKALTWANQYDIELESVEPFFIDQCQPGLGLHPQQCLWLPRVCNVRNPRLLSALKKAISQRPLISVHENTPVTELLFEQRKAQGVLTKAGKFYADKTLVTSGAWSHQLLNTIGAGVKIWPIRGQMLLYRPGPELLNTIVLYGNRYLIPRKDGHILVGSTLENVGFDKTTTEQACAELKAFAESMLPALADYPVIQQWAGLRPASPAGIPQIGPIHGYENLFINAGHYRNGVVLAPGSVQILIDQMLGQPTSLDCGPYQPLGH